MAASGGKMTMDRLLNPYHLIITVHGHPPFRSDSMCHISLYDFAFRDLPVLPHNMTRAVEELLSSRFTFDRECNPSTKQ